MPDGCAAYFKALDCIASKMPAEAASQVRESFEKIKQTMQEFRTYAATVCATSLEAMQPALKAQGCVVSSEPAGSVSPSASSPPPIASSAPSAGERSPVPTRDEWDAVPREVTVVGSSKLHCETKQIREWIRVSCHGKNDTGGEPTGVRVTKGGGKGDDFTFASKGTTSLVYRFLEGQELEAQFDWTDQSRQFVSQWPKGAKEPTVKGVFL